MTLTIALAQFLPLETHSGYHWVAMIYFIASKIRFFQGDLVVAMKLQGVEKSGVEGHRIFGFFAGIGSMFMFLAAAFDIMEAMTFFRSYSIAVILDTVWVWNMNGMIDPGKDDKLAKEERRNSFREVFRSWLTFGCLRGFGLLIASLILASSLADNVDVSRWTIRLGLGLSASMLLMDYAWNHTFYFVKLESKSEER